MKPTIEMHEFAFVEMIQAAIGYRIGDPVTYERKLDILQQYIDEAEDRLNKENWEDGCVCSEFDGNGWSTCGLPCPEHNKQ